MTRHSKNNVSLHYFTNAEKQKMNYGTQTQRLGADSQSKFNECRLCLSTARVPVCCPLGDLYCRECILENILAQKKLIERDLRESKSAETDQERQERLQLEKKKEEFINQETRVVSTIENEKLDLTSTAFWLPYMQPSANHQQKVTKTSPQCPAGDHSISSKKLIQVKFNNDTTCPVCLKLFKNGVQISVMKPCGHAICKPCTLKFVKKSKVSAKDDTTSKSTASSTNKDIKDTEKDVKMIKCPCCEEKVKECIDLRMEGTGFAAAGKAQVVKQDVAFM